MAEDKKSILLICDCHKLATSGGRLIGDLVDELRFRGFEIHVLGHKPKNLYREGQATRTKKTNSNYYRGFLEIKMVLKMTVEVIGLRNKNFVGVISYSPSIFLFLPAIIAKIKYKIVYYQILRDIFPLWMLETGGIRPGLVYDLLLWISKLSYCSASKIGVQSKVDKKYVQNAVMNIMDVEVLNNWRTPIRLKMDRRIEQHNEGKIRLIYAGNVGGAQHLDFVFSQLLNLNTKKTLEISVYGFGRELKSVEDFLRKHRYCSNITFHDPVPERELADLMDNYDFGLVSLDERLTTGNIPGKILTYMDYDLPVLGVGGDETELQSLIKQENIGIYITFADLKKFKSEKILDLILNYNNPRCSETLQQCLREKFSTQVVADRIVRNFMSTKGH